MCVSAFYFSSFHFLYICFLCGGMTVGIFVFTDNLYAFSEFVVHILHLGLLLDVTTLCGCALLAHTTTPDKCLKSHRLCTRFRHFMCNVSSLFIFSLSTVSTGVKFMNSSGHCCYSSGTQTANNVKKRNEWVNKRQPTYTTIILQFFGVPLQYIYWIIAATFSHYACNQTSLV